MTLISIAQIVEEVQDLPTLPAVVMEILNKIDDEETDTHELAEKVTHDIALTAKTLRYANSAYYSTMVKVTTIQQAISLLGLATVRQLIVTAALTGCFPEQRCEGFSHKNFWRHSNMVAIVSQILAKRVGFNSDVAFTAGLLHDIGTLVLVTYHAEEYEKTLAWQQEQQTAQLPAERHIMGIDHTEVGDMLALQWNFSEHIRHAISGHHHPDRPGLGFLTAIVHAANSITHALAVTSSEDIAQPEMNRVAWESLHLDEDSLQQILKESAKAFQQLEEKMDV